LDKEEDDLLATRASIDKNEAAKAQLEAQEKEEKRLAAAEAKKQREELENAEN